MSALFLGPVTFQDFELPGRIVFGGRQRVAVHQLPGGGRVIDALGRDDAPLAWTGVFTGPDAAARALTLDLMRAEGLTQPLAWDVFSYLVVVTDFAASYERGNWIPYRIGCTVLIDASAVLAQTALSLVQSVLGDLAGAAGIAGLDLSAATSAISLAGATASGSGAYAAAGAALGLAAGSLATSLTGAGNTLVTATDFPTIAAAAQQSAQLAAAQGYVQRAQTNLANAGS